MGINRYIVVWVKAHPRGKAHPYLSRQVPVPLAQSSNQTMRNEAKPIWARSILAKTSRQESYINLMFYPYYYNNKFNNFERSHFIVTLTKTKCEIAISMSPTSCYGRCHWFIQAIIWHTLFFCTVTHSMRGKAHPHVGQSASPCGAKRTPVWDKVHPHCKSQWEWLFF